jgi:hypothetical protein
MKLFTLIEYCLLIFLAGIYFAFLGFHSNGLTFIIGVILLYIIVNISIKNILPKYQLENIKISTLISVVSIIGMVFITMLLLTILAI